MTESDKNLETMPELYDALYKPAGSSAIKFEDQLSEGKEEGQATAPSCENVTKFDFDDRSAEGFSRIPELKLCMLGNQMSAPSERGDGSSKILKISGIRCDAPDLRVPLEAFGPLANLENHLQRQVIIAIYRHLSDAQVAFDALESGIVAGMPHYESVRYVPKNLKSDDLYRSFRLGTESTDSVNDSQHQNAALTLNMLKIKTSRAETGSDYGSLCNSQGSIAKRPPPEERVHDISATEAVDPFQMASDTHRSPDELAAAMADVGSRNSCDEVPLGQLSDRMAESYRHSDGGKAYGLVGPFATN